MDPEVYAVFVGSNPIMAVEQCKARPVVWFWAVWFMLLSMLHVGGDMVVVLGDAVVVM